MIWVNNMSFFNTLFQWCMKYCVFSKGTKTKQKQPLFCMHCDSFRSFCCSKDNDKQFMSLLYNTLVKYKGCTNVISFWKKSVLRIVVFIVCRGIQTIAKFRLLTKIDFNVMHLINLSKFFLQKLQIRDSRGLQNSAISDTFFQFLTILCSKNASN